MAAEPSPATGKDVIIQVHLLNDIYKTLKVTPETTVEDLTHMMIAKMELGPAAASMFAIFHIQAGYERKPGDKESVVAIWNNFAEDEKRFKKNKKVYKFIGSSQLLFKKWSFSRRSEILMTEPQLVELLYIQAVSDVISSRIPSHGPEAMTLAGLQMQADFGDHDERTRPIGYLKSHKLIPKYVPLAFLKAKVHSDAKWEEEIHKLYLTNAGMTREAAKLAYLTAARKNTFYGCIILHPCELHMAGELMSEDRHVVAVSSANLMVLDKKRTKAQVTFPLNHINKWGRMKQDNIMGFQFKTSTGKNIDYTVSTPQAQYLCEVLTKATNAAVDEREVRKMAVLAMMTPKAHMDSRKATDKWRRFARNRSLAKQNASSPTLGDTASSPAAARLASTFSTPDIEHVNSMGSTPASTGLNSPATPGSVDWGGAMGKVTEEGESDADSEAPAKKAPAAKPAAASPAATPVVTAAKLAPGATGKAPPATNSTSGAGGVKVGENTNAALAALMAMEDGDDAEEEVEYEEVEVEEEEGEVEYEEVEVSEDDDEDPLAALAAIKAPAKPAAKPAPAAALPSPAPAGKSAPNSNTLPSTTTLDTDDVLAALNNIQPAKPAAKAAPAPAPAPGAQSPSVFPASPASAAPRSNTMGTSSTPDTAAVVSMLDRIAEGDERSAPPKNGPMFGDDDEDDNWAQEDDVPAADMAEVLAATGDGPPVESPEPASRSFAASSMDRARPPPTTTTAGNGWGAGAPGVSPTRATSSTSVPPSTGRPIGQPRPELMRFMQSPERAAPLPAPPGTQVVRRVTRRIVRRADAPGLSDGVSLLNASTASRPGLNTTSASTTAPAPAAAPPQPQVQVKRVVRRVRIPLDADGFPMPDALGDLPIDLPPPPRDVTEIDGQRVRRVLVRRVVRPQGGGEGGDGAGWARESGVNGPDDPRFSLSRYDADGRFVPPPQDGASFVDYGNGSGARVVTRRVVVKAT